MSPSPRILSSDERQQLRKTLRSRRNAVPAWTRKAIALRIARTLSAHILRPTLRIAIYSAFDGEIDVRPVAASAQRLGCRLFAPVIVARKQRKMEFVSVNALPSASAAATPNHFGITEPRDAVSRRVSARRLDVILVPVVAFDAQGWRLGFGGGYYDRKLAFKRRRIVRKPLLIGVGYEFQRIGTVMASPWDVKLDAVVTERGLRRCR